MAKVIYLNFTRLHQENKTWIQNITAVKFTLEIFKLINSISPNFNLGQFIISITDQLQTESFKSE